MKLETVRVIRCPTCSVLFKPDESVTVFTVGDCPNCLTNIQGEPFYLVHDASLKKKLKPKPEEPFIPSEKPKPSRDYKCGNCRKTGHNVRGCPDMNGVNVIKDEPEPEPEPEPSPGGPWNDREYTVVKTYIIEARGKPCHTGTMATHYDLPEALISRICEHLIENVKGFRARTDARGYYFFDKEQVT